MAAAKKFNTRRSTRFRPERPTLARAKIDASNSPVVVRGIVKDESYRGACVIFEKKTELNRDSTGTIVVGDLPELGFRVVWIAEVREDFVKAGIEYLE